MRKYENQRLRRMGGTISVFLCLAASSLGRAEEVKPNGLVILLTDYGAADFYVGALKGAIYSAFPQARIDSITHEVPPFDIREGAYLLAGAAREFPLGTTFVAVVDPGVGTERKPLAAETESGHFFVAPDNGLLTLVFAELGVRRVHEITNPQVLRPGALSSTFHGRDLFGPAGAHLAAGFPLVEVGPELKQWVTLKIETGRLEEGAVLGEVVHVDRYGNLLTNIPRELLAQLPAQRGDRLKVTVGEQTRKMPFVKTYGDVPEGEFLLLIHSLDEVEIAINLGSAAGVTGARAGTKVKIARP